MQYPPVYSPGFSPNLYSPSLNRGTQNGMNMAAQGTPMPSFSFNTHYPSRKIQQPAPPTFSTILQSQQNGLDLSALSTLAHQYKIQNKRESAMKDITPKRGALIGAIGLGAPFFVAQGITGLLWGTLVGALAGGTITSLIRKKKS